MTIKKACAAIMRWPKWLRVVAGFLICISLVFLAFDIPARLKFSSTKAEIERFDSAIASFPHSAQNDPIVGRGNGILESIDCMPDVQCPDVTHTWIVPIAPNKEQDFIDAIMNQTGYSSFLEKEHRCIFNSGGDHGFCSKSFRNNTFDIGIRIEEADNFHHHIPKANISPSNWRSVTVNVTAE